MRKWIVFWMLLVIGRVGGAVTSEFYTIKTQTTDKLVIEFHFPDLQVQTLPGGQNSRVEIPGLNYHYELNQPLVPLLVLPLNLPRNVSAPLVTIHQIRRFTGISPPVYQNDSLQVEPPGTTVLPFPGRIVKLVYQGLFRDFPIYALRVYPVQVTAEGIRFFQKFSVTLYLKKQSAGRQGKYAAKTAAELPLLKKWVANQEQSGFVEALAASSIGQTLNQDEWNFKPRIRLVVVEKGVYKVTGADLEEHGIDLNRLDPRTFRLVNRGQEVPFLLYGEQDGRFDPDDYIEFLGEPNDGTFLKEYPDMYKDPFTDENVYWLEWGGHPGVRMVEESGGIVTTDPTRYNPAPFYAHTVHVEEDNHFERLGFGSIGSLSYQRDLWYFDTGIKSIGKKQYPFELIYPDSTSFNPVEVKVMFSGKSIGGSPHNVMVWLNNGLIGMARPGWFNQDTATVSNVGNSNIRTLDLRHGENILDVQLPVKPPVGTDIVLLNWFEVTYDRQYRAYRNQIEFRKPSIVFFPNVNLFQFEIDGFTRSDIQIYKKGIGKIINYKLEIEEVKGRKMYKVIFQDHIIADDVEYVAITEDLKKKPLRIELDEPFDPERPELTLKNPANSADYLIITHQRFYRQALELRDYRRSQGLAVELVRVQDIYDEFNHGIKSPLAIRDFLQYAYYHWDQNHKLKYVLLLGDANYDYKSTSTLFTDFVPTFFLQTFKFGAAATDYPYSLLSGDDLIPDVFVGRIPVMVASDVTVATEKIIEYEQNPILGPWRNQALFISGNDASTFEFDYRDRPLFRVQNARMLEVLLPQHHTAFRLNTVKDPTKDYDPNFGGTTDLIEYFDDGLYYINFLGHGGGAIWADVNLFNLRDVDRLNNKGMYPFITSMTCFTGAFDNPGNMGLAQKLVLAKDKGAIGVLASSGLGWAYNDFAMLWSVGQFLFNPEFRVGEAVTLGKIFYLTSQSNYFVNDTLFTAPGYFYLFKDMVHQYNLIGDPYIQFEAVPTDLTLELDNALPQPGDTIQVTLSVPFAPAEGYIELADYQNNVVTRMPVYTTGQTESVRLVIPESFPEGTGRLRAYLSDGQRDASNVVPIGINYAVLDSIVLLPRNPSADDSVYLQLHVRDPFGVRQVYVLVANIRQRFSTREIRSGVFQTVRPLPPTYALQTVFFSVYVENNRGNKSVFRNRSYTILDDRPDVFVEPRSIRFGGRERVKVTAVLGNKGRSVAQNVPVHFYQGETNFKNHTPFAVQTVNISPGDSIHVGVDFPFNLSRDQFRLYVAADPQGRLPDFNRNNNVDSVSLTPTLFNVTPELGTTYDGVTGDTLRLGDRVALYIPAGAVDRPSVLLLRWKSVEPPRDQKGLQLLPVVEQDQYHAVEVRLLNLDAQTNQPFYLRIKPRPIANYGTSPLQEVTLYRKVGTSQPWVAVETDVEENEGYVYTRTHRDGMFAPFISGDLQPPRIELTVDGRPFQTRAQVSSNPVMHLVIEDESGVILSPEQIAITIDGQPLAPDKIFIPDSVRKSNILGITLYPELEVGQHDLKVQAKDVNGNLAEKQYDLLVSDEFDVHVFGNYPNPFTDQTIFAYYVSPDVLDEFEIRIYTVSGRLIRVITEDINTINQPHGARASGYNELIWDGTDEEGNEVANGVYFALIRAKYQGEVKETILKVAKLK